MTINAQKYCINYLEAHDIECYQQGEDVIIYVSDLEITLSQEEISYRAELWLESEIEGVKVGTIKRAIGNY